MSFEAGTITVRCPKCGDSATLKVSVDWVTLDERKAAGYDASRTSKIRATLIDQPTVDHACAAVTS